MTDLESFLVRRLVCNLTTKNYNLLFRSLLRRLREADTINRAIVQQFLSEGAGPAVRWPNDREFERGWLANDLYRLLVSPRITAILEAIDLQLLTNKQERIHLPSSLSVEHVMPEHWQGAWPAPTSRGADGNAEENAIERRDRLIHTLGNLTLLTQVLNSSVSN